MAQRPPTFDHLKKKQPIERTVTVVLDDDDQTMAVKFRSIGRKAYDELVRQHEPTEKQREEVTDGELTWNPDTFPIALVAASMIEPKATEEQVAELFEAWNGSEVMDLFMTALEVNTQRRVADLGKASGETLV